MASTFRPARSTTHPRPLHLRPTLRPTAADDEIATQPTPVTRHTNIPGAVTWPSCTEQYNTPGPDTRWPRGSPGRHAGTPRRSVGYPTDGGRPPKRARPTREVRPGVGANVHSRPGRRGRGQRGGGSHLFSLVRPHHSGGCAAARHVGPTQDFLLPTPALGHPPSCQARSGWSTFPPSGDAQAWSGERVQPQSFRIVQSCTVLLPLRRRCSPFPWCPFLHISQTASARAGPLPRRGAVMLPPPQSARQPPTAKGGALVEAEFLDSPEGPMG